MFSFRKPKDLPVPEGDQDIMAEEIGDAMSKAVDEWIRPELAAIVGWPAVNKITDADFEAVLQAQYKMLFLKKSHTLRKTGATFYFKLCQGVDMKGKFTVLSKFTYDFDFDDYLHKESGL